MVCMKVRIIFFLVSKIVRKWFLGSLIYLGM
nr:MAG TPA: hypothetical protein [Caudoviricetes sp.]